MFTSFVFLVVLVMICYFCTIVLKSSEMHTLFLFGCIKILYRGADVNITKPLIFFYLFISITARQSYLERCWWATIRENNKLSVFYIAYNPQVTDYVRGMKNFFYLFLFISLDYFVGLFFYRMLELLNGELLFSVL